MGISTHRKYGLAIIEIFEKKKEKFSLLRQRHTLLTMHAVPEQNFSIVSIFLQNIRGKFGVQLSQNYVWFSWQERISSIFTKETRKVILVFVGPLSSSFCERLLHNEAWLHDGVIPNRTFCGYPFFSFRKKNPFTFAKESAPGDNGMKCAIWEREISLRCVICHRFGGFAKCSQRVWNFPSRDTSKETQQILGGWRQHADPGLSLIKQFFLQAYVYKWKDANANFLHKFACGHPI